ncbi:hypothetical protein QZH41_002035 [Actinostola sp. cb2023]|nr:hypothetical protein QZH41_002035 [Actinostola sp. cb2023]
MAEESGQLPPTSASSSQATSISPEIVAAIQLAVDRSMAANLQSTGSLPQPSVPGAVTAMMVPTVEALSTAGGAGVSSQAGAIGGRCSLVVPSFMNTFSSPVVSALPSTTALTSAIATGSMGPPIPAAIAGSPIGILPTLYQPFVVGPGYFPVPARLVAQIVSGKFVDLSDLLPSNLTLVTESEPQLLLDGRLVLTSQPKKHKRRLEDVATSSMGTTIADADSTPSFGRANFTSLDSQCREFLLQGLAPSTRRSYATGVFSFITVQFTFHRRLGYFLIQMYAPDIFIVMLSWIVFWMDRRDVGSRMALGITTILTIMFLMGSINESMPKVSYPKALDWYLIVSFGFIFCALVQCLIAYRTSNMTIGKKAVKNRDLENQGSVNEKQFVGQPQNV